MGGSRSSTRRAGSVEAESCPRLLVYYVCRLSIPAARGMGANVERFSGKHLPRSGSLNGAGQADRFGLSAYGRPIEEVHLGNIRRVA